MSGKYTKHTKNVRCHAATKLSGSGDIVLLSSGNHAKSSTIEFLYIVFSINLTILLIILNY